MRKVRKIVAELCSKGLKLIIEALQYLRNIVSNALTYVEIEKEDVPRRA